MTLGLAVGTSQAIYLAIESSGLAGGGYLGVKSETYRSGFTLLSKILDLQFQPGVSVLIAGGLEQWQHIADKYRLQGSLQASVHEVCQLLDQCMGPQNQAYGLVCGVDGGVAQYVRIDRPCRAGAAIVSNQGGLTSVQPIGGVDPSGAAQEADQLVRNGLSPLEAIVQAIEGRIAKQWFL